jgi:hypothetical protein
VEGGLVIVKVQVRHLFRGRIEKNHCKPQSPICGLGVEPGTSLMRNNNANYPSAEKEIANELRKCVIEN